MRSPFKSKLLVNTRIQNETNFRGSRHLTTSLEPFRDNPDVRKLKVKALSPSKPSTCLLQTSRVYNTPSASSLDSTLSSSPASPTSTLASSLATQPLSTRKRSQDPDDSHSEGILLISLILTVDLDAGDLDDFDNGSLDGFGSDDPNLSDGTTQTIVEDEKYFAAERMI
jgi:hypothetical protein